MSRSLRLTLIVFGALSFGLRCLAFFNYRFDSDEPQHLHVAWGWTAGLVQYRDLFDNHAPLFHMLSAPLVRLVGERSDILFFMRAAMLPLFALMLACTWVVARRLYDERVAWTAVVLVSLFPPFFLKSLEYRTDNLWTALWMVALLVIVGRPMTLARSLLAGLILGAALAVSMKTTLLLITLGGAAVLTFRIRGRVVAGFAAGFVIVPALVAAYFIRIGAWDAMRYCVFEFNELVTLTRSYVWAARIAYLLAITGVIAVARRMTGIDPWRRFCATASAVFVVTLVCFWILISPRDFLPLMPLLAIFSAAALLRTERPALATGTAATIFAISLFYYAEGFENRTREFNTMIDQVIGLSRPGETLVDIKGETIFRRRVSYHIYEAITRALMRRGIVRDDIRESVIAANCHIAQADGPMLPPKGRAFLSENFLDLGRIRASGQWLADDGTFTIAVPGEYVILTDTGPLPGSLDGTPYTGKRPLAAGAHRFAPMPKGGRVAVVWAPAIERGYSPFVLRDLRF